jgi:hypothetical protein
MCCPRMNALPLKTGYQRRGPEDEMQICTGPEKENTINPPIVYQRPNPAPYIMLGLYPPSA